MTGLVPWEVMLATLALLFQTVATPVVNHNHFYVTLDPPTINAIARNRWLKKFADVNVSTNSSGSDTWTGCYVYGVASYVELFATGKKEKEGECGIGFATPLPGGADNLYSNFLASPFGKRAQRDEMKLGSKGHEKPFAHISSYDGQDPTKLNVWVMEFDHEMYAKHHLPDGAPYSQIVAAYSKENKKPYRGMMGDVTSITTQPLGDGEDFRRALALYGYKKVGATNVYRQRENEVIVLPAQKSRTKYAITSVRFSLRTPPKKIHVERFSSHCVLTAYPDGHAVWKFN